MKVLLYQSFIDAYASWVAWAGCCHGNKIYRKRYISIVQMSKFSYLNVYILSHSFCHYMECFMLYSNIELTWVDCCFSFDYKRFIFWTWQLRKDLQCTFHTYCIAFQKYHWQISVLTLNTCKILLWTFMQLKRVVNLCMTS
jgi:hypothetical protein